MRYAQGILLGGAVAAALAVGGAAVFFVIAPSTPSNGDQRSEISDQ